MEKAAGKTINDEVGVLFRVMGDSRDMIRLKLHKGRKLKQRNDVGRALTLEKKQEF